MAYYKAVVAYYGDANSQMQLSQGWELAAPAKGYQYLSQKWALQAGPRDSVLLRQVRYICRLSKTGQTDLIIPMGSFQGRLKDGDPTYFSIIIPNGKEYAADITSRIDGILTITREGVQEDGTIKSDEIMRGTLEDIRQDRGANSSSLTLSGHERVSYSIEGEDRVIRYYQRTTGSSTGGQTGVIPGYLPRNEAGDRIISKKRIALEGANYRAEYGGKRRFRCRFDQELRPSDIAQIKETEEEITVGEISYQVGTNVTVMEIAEA